jgi:TRAP-type C4-dicarboxylate transport system permease small subunit
MRRLGPIDRLSKLTGQAVSWVFLAAVAITFYEVVARYLFNAPTIWAHESTIFLCAIGFIFGGVYALQRGDHIRITVVYDLLPERARRVVDIANTLLILGILCLLIYAVGIQAQRALAVMERTGTAWNVPIPAFLKTLLVVGAALMALQAAAQLWALIARRDRPDHDTSHRNGSPT